MRIGRTLPPAATPIGLKAIFLGLWGILKGKKELRRFESELKDYFGAEHCFLVSSGKAAFTLILLALKEMYPDKDEVMVPAFTCYSVPSAIVRAGLRVRLCDLEAGSTNLDFKRISDMFDRESGARSDESPTTNADNSSMDVHQRQRPSTSRATRVLAVVPTHLFGYPVDVPRLREALGRSGVVIIEDAAQAMGGTLGDKRLGTLGDVGFFSLARGKAFSVVEGGVILTNSPDLAARLKRQVSQIPGYRPLALLKLILKAVALMMLSHPLLFWIPRSIPFLRLGETLFETGFPILRMSSFQAGLARGWVTRLQTLKNTREANVERWRTVLDSMGRSDAAFPASGPIGLLRMPVRVSDQQNKRRLLRESALKGLGVMPVYPKSINQLSEVRAQSREGSFPVAECCARELVTLPTHGYLTAQDVDSIKGLLLRAFSKEGDLAA